ncbi:MAG: 2-hydroxyacyl-CoA dehydratase [Eggerthellaceae bacterium]|jgi:predicted nucleotide-binding protein (sugar kinase/HSP70/actin superfamily)
MPLIKSNHRRRHTEPKEPKATQVDLEPAVEEGKEDKTDDSYARHAANHIGHALDSFDTTHRKRRYEDTPQAQFYYREKDAKPFSLVPKRKKKKRDRHARTKVAVFRYGYYDVLFKFFVEHVLDADFVELPEPTRETLASGAAISNDMICAPFKHMLGDFIEALDRGAEVLVQLSGPCRLGFYGELQEFVLRERGYDFEMLNFAMLSGKPLQDYLKECQRKVNPNMSIANGVKGMLGLFKMLESLDNYHDYYLEHAGFETIPHSFEKAEQRFLSAMGKAKDRHEIEMIYEEGLEELKAIDQTIPADPIRVGLLGDFYTAVDPASNLYLEKKLEGMGVSLSRLMNLSTRIVHYNEKALRASVPEYVTYDMGPTSTMNIAAAKDYAERGYDGLIHMKSAGCTPEIDCVPILQRISRDYGIPVLFLSYDSQTSDTGLNTRLEAFYDMIAMRKARS